MPRQQRAKPIAGRILGLVKTGAKWFGIFLAVLAVGGFLFMWSGLYSVAASRGHWAVFGLILEFAMRSSVRTHAFGIETPDLADPALAIRGAGHYQGGCAPCHGAPGRASSPIVHAMLPEPPDLGEAVPTWQPGELFWIVKHGLKYTGMPAWVAQQRDDEVWAVVAFLQGLPQMSVSQYHAMAGLNPPEAVPVRNLAQGGPVGTALAACSRCHGLDGAGHAGGAFPRLDIQPANYLLAQLQAYDAGTRHSGMMQPVAAELDETDRRRLADYYAAQRTAMTPLPNAGGNPIFALGRKLATVGVPEQSIPPCLSCHALDGASRNPLYPALAGQYASYTAQQLHLFRSGQRKGTAAAEIMSVIAMRLTDEQIEAASIYFAGEAR
jgi:cytochrome c553